MKELAHRPLTGEVIGPSEGVWVIGRQRPFESRSDRIKLPAGLTIAELLDAAIERKSKMAEYVVYIDGIPIPRDMHERVRVKAGHTVTYAPRLTGPNGRSIATIALAVVALVAAVFLPPLVGPIIAGLIGAGIVIGGGLLINALFPIAPTTALQDQRKGFDTAFEISGAQNTADPFGPVPLIFGRIRVWPRYGARPYVTFSGNNQHLKMLFVIGYGSLAISDLRIGETPIDEFQEVTYNIFENYSTGDSPGPEIYTQQVFQEQLSVELTEDISWQLRVTALEVTSLEVIITLPNGWYEVDPDTGDLEGRDIEIQSQYRPFGASGWSTLENFSESNYKAKKRRTIGLSKTGLDADQYEVRVRKSSNDSGDTDVVEDIFWTALTAKRDDPPIDFAKPLTLLEVDIKASEQLSGVVDTLNCIAEARVIAYDADISPPSWVPSTLSRNPADAFVWALQGPGISEPVDDDLIDFETLAGWHTFCEEQDFEFNFEHARRNSVFDTLQMIAASGKARVTRIDGLWGVIWDELEVPVAQHFTPRNSWGFGEQRAYFNPPHALRVNFINEERSYSVDEIRVYRSGYTSVNATIFEAVEFPGVTNSTQITTLATFQADQAQARPSTYTLTTDWQSLSCTIGDKVYCAHDAILIGQAQARVVAVAGDVVTVDEQVLFEYGTYAIRFRQPDGDSVLRTVGTQTPGYTNQFTLTASASADPEVGDLLMFGLSDPGPAQLFRVRDVEWLPDLTARLTLVDDM